MSSPVATRKVPVAFRMPQAKVGRGHVLPDLGASGASKHFVTLPRGGASPFGMVAFAGIAVTAQDMLQRWQDTFGQLADEGRAISLLQQYVDALQPIKIGTVVSIAVSDEGILRLRVEPHRPVLTHRPRLP